MTKKKQKIFITGAGGFLGSHLCEAFLEQGFEVCGTVLHGWERVAHLSGHARFKTVSLDLTDAEATARAVAECGPDGVVHAAAFNPQSPVESPFPFLEGNVRATVSALNATQKAGVKKFVYISSMSVYGKGQLTLPVSEEHPVRPGDFYSATKHMGEEWCKLYRELFGIHTTVLRCAGIYGPRRDYGAVSNFILNARAGGHLELERNIGWDLVYVKDVATAVVQSFEARDRPSGNMFNIGSGVETNVEELARLVIRETDSNSTVRFGAEYTSKPPSHFYFDISKARRLLGFNPIPLERGIQETVQFLQTASSLL